jgi:hypothetical protein
MVKRKLFEATERHIGHRSSFVSQIPWFCWEPGLKPRGGCLILIPEVKHIVCALLFKALCVNFSDRIRKIETERENKTDSHDERYTEF